MTWRLWAVLALLLPQPAWAGPAARFAIVVGNNRPERADAEPLHYADDDAVAVHRLLLEAKVASILLTRLDDDTQRLAGDVRPTATPRRDALESAFAAQAQAIRAANRSGNRTELIFYFSGHGDVDQGEGYAVLEDGRLSRTVLYDLLARSPAERNHVFVDACKSYFLAFDKGAGGQRTPYGRHFATPSTPGQLANTGFVLSTSSARDSHEWERYQGGILSHEVRSALRGAADLNRDGRITYAELGAFVVAANRTIDSPRFRPDFTVWPPGGRLDETVLEWPSGLEVVETAPGDVGHIYVETEQGDRVLDAHPESSQAMALHLPASRPLFVRQNDEQAEFVLVQAGAARVERLDTATPPIAAKGARAIAFSRLFTAAFGLADLKDFTERQDAEIAMSAQPQASATAIVKTTLGLTSLVASAAALTFGILTVREYVENRNASQEQLASANSTIIGLRTVSLVALGVAGATGLAWALIPAKPFVVSPVITSTSARLDIGTRF